MARLRKEEEARAYERMINPPPPYLREAEKGNHPRTIGSDDIGQEDELTFADINRQVAAIFNVLLSIVACSVAIWMAARHWSTPSRLGLSMGGGGLVGVAEVAIYAGYLRRILESKQKEKKIVERKVITDTWSTQEKSKEPMDITASTDNQIRESDGLRLRTRPVTD
jgi:TMEM199 family protein